MKIVIPAKSNSVRVPNKNWREFHEGASLFDIKISQLLEVFPAKDIFVSCEDESRRKQIEEYNVNFLLRDLFLAADETHWSDVVTGIIESVPCNDKEDIAWVQLPCPLFNAECFKRAWVRWKSIPKDLYDCLITVQDFQDFVVDETGRPMNFQFGCWHHTSQELPSWYLIPRQFHIMKKETYLRCHYDIGTRPYLYSSNSLFSDINHEHEFRYAQYCYKEMNGLLA